MSDYSDNNEPTLVNRRSCLQTLTAGSMITGLNTGIVSLEIDAEVAQQANRNNLSDIAQWQFSPTPGYDREDSFFTYPYPNNDTVYAGDIGGRMHALNTGNGEQRWRYEEADLPIWGQPVAHQNKVYFGTGEPGDNGSVYALNSDTGEEEWSLSDFNEPIQKPIIAANGIVYFVAGEETYAVDSDTGEQLWTKQLGGIPAIKGDTAYFYTGSPTAIDAESGDVIWETRTNFSTGPHQPLVTESGVYAGNGFYDVNTGEEIFTFDIKLSEQSVISDEFLFTRDDSNIHVFETDSGEYVREISVSGNVRSMLCIDQTLYVGTAQTEDGGGEGESGGILYVINADTGEHLWAVSSRNAELRLSPHIYNGFVFIATTTGQLFAVGHGNNPFADSGATTVFQSLSDNSNSIIPLGLLGIGGIGAYFGYQKLRSKGETDSKSKDLGSETNDERADLAYTDESSQTQLEVPSYDELNSSNIIKETSNYQLQCAEVADQFVWILTPPIDDSKTVNTTIFETFSKELDSWSRMDSHPQLLNIFRIGTKPVPWAAIEESDDTPLVGQGDTFSITETVDALKQVCDALHHVHRYGEAYKNLTTESILYTDQGEVKLRGILDQFEEANPWYNAPEEFDGVYTERSTVYRIGVITYELLTETLPYAEYPGGDPEAAVRDAKLSSLDEQLRDLPSDVAAILKKALTHSPEDRYETVLHMRDAFEQT